VPHPQKEEGGRNAESDWDGDAHTKEVERGKKEGNSTKYWVLVTRGCGVRLEGGIWSTEGCANVDGR